MLTGTSINLVQCHLDGFALTILWNVKSYERLSVDRGENKIESFTSHKNSNLNNL